MKIQSKKYLSQHERLKVKTILTVVDNLVRALPSDLHLLEEWDTFYKEFRSKMLATKEK